MRRIFTLLSIFVLSCVLLLGAWQSFAQLSSTGAGKKAGCSEATTFLARASLTGTDATNYTNYICCQVTAGTWALKDIQYIFAAPDTTTAQLNLISTSFSAVLNGSPNFSANNGYLGVDASTTVYIDTQFNPGSGTPNYAQNSAHFSAWSLTNAAATTGGVIIGVSTGLSQTYLYPKFSDNNYYMGINTNTGFASGASASSVGLFLGTRTASNLQTVYKNGSSLSTDASASVAVPIDNFYVLAQNTPGSGATLGGGYRIAMASAGAALNGTQVTNDYNCAQTFMTATGH